MVNYCCVRGCSSNSKRSKHLFYYSLPKDNPRLDQWIQLIGRQDLLDRNLKKLSYRVCSRHFSPSSIKNKHLCADAVPTLCLSNDKEVAEPKEESFHKEIACNSCNKLILGYRYKCITCPDYDLCCRCEMCEAHSEHFMLRIPKPVNFKVADDLIKKFQHYDDIEHVTVDSQRPLNDSSSDDDIPIKRYVKQNDSGIDLTEEMKLQIRNEVTRVLSIKHNDNKKKRKKESKKKESCKKVKIDTTEEKCFGTEDLMALVPEVVFADVNNIRGSQILNIKTETTTNLAADIAETHQPMTDLNFADADFMLTTLN